MGSGNQKPRIRIVGRSKWMEERVKQFRERSGFSLDDIDRPGFFFVDRCTGRSLIDRTAPKAPTITDKKERAKRFRESVGISLDDIGRPGFFFVDRWTGKSLIDRTAPKRLIIKDKKERAKRFREEVGIDPADIGKPGFYLADRLTGRSFMERARKESPIHHALRRVWALLQRILGVSN